LAQGVEDREAIAWGNLGGMKSSGELYFEPLGSNAVKPIE
jgi:hypothetical protein